MTPTPPITDATLHRRCSCCKAEYVPTDPCWRESGMSWGPEHACPNNTMPQSGHFPSEACQLVYVIHLNGPGGGLVVDSLDGLMSEIRSLAEEMTTADDIAISAKLMTKEEIDATPEHAGW